MAQKSIEGNNELAYAIKARRNELQMTIEEAADKAGVGTKTWCRYEAGESIRQDKCKGICKALNWIALPGVEKSDDDFDLAKYKFSKYWPSRVEKIYGETAALSFVIGSEILEDYIQDDMASLSKMPRGSHVGEVDISFLAGFLPPQFLTRYDYEFLYALKATLINLKTIASHSGNIVTCNVMEELALYLVVEVSRMLIEGGYYLPEDNWDEWIYDLFEDMDLVTLLYSGQYVTSDNIYHFSHWNDELS